MAQSKRKATGDADAETSSSDSDTQNIDVDFEWFSPSEIDFHGLKHLLKQLFDADNDLFDLSSLADLIISQPGIGSCVKCPSDDESIDIKDTDPYAFLTALNLHAHRERQEVVQLREYLLKKAEGIPSLASEVRKLLSRDSRAQVGLLLGERFINMPNEVMAPTYSFLLSELDEAVKEDEPFNFSHILVLSKTYTEIASKLDSMVITEGSEPPSKKTKKSRKAAGGSAVKAETFYFHAEDEVLQRYAVGFGDFHYMRQGDPGASDAKRAFHEMGIEPVGHMILLEAGKFREAVQAVGQYFGQAG